MELNIRLKENIITFKKGNFIKNKLSDRLGGKTFGKNISTYKFAAIKQAKEKAKGQFPEVPFIDMGVGEPDMAADIEICKVLYEQSMLADNRFYADNGIAEFQLAAGDYLKKVYGVRLENSLEQIMHGIGSKSILAMIPSIFINPGDITLTTVPGYPILATWTKYLGGEVYELPLNRENSFYPDLNNIPQEVLKRAKLLYINYPNNPTGQVATMDFYKQVVDFATKNDVFVISDAAYSSLNYDDNLPLSFLSVEGAINIGAEVHSLSKAFNMTGWRLAFVVGSTEFIQAFGTVKDNSDSGQFRAIQKAGIYALKHPELTKIIIEKYSRRLNYLVSALNDVGFEAIKPKGTFYCYVRSPIGAKNIRFNNAAEATQYIIEKAMISIIPWDDAGAYLRFSVTFEAKNELEEIEVINEMKSRLLKLELKFS